MKNYKNDYKNDKNYKNEKHSAYFMKHIPTPIEYGLEISFFLIMKLEI